AFKDVELRVRAGEVVGIGGLLGSGKSQFVRSVAGVAKPSEGSVKLRGQAVSGSIAKRKRRGMSFVSGDRKGESLLGAFSVAENISLPRGEAGSGGFSNWLGVWKSGAERREARRLIDEYGIKARASSTISQLSGGNQQKVALARWVRRE